MTPFELDMALQRGPVFYMMRRGIRIDKAKKEFYAKTAHEEWDNAQRLLNELSGKNLNVNSSKQVQAYLYGELKVPTRTKMKKPTVDEDALRAIMAQSAQKVKEAKRDETKERWFRIHLSVKVLLKIRTIRKRLSSYTGCPPDCSCKNPSEILFDGDGRMRCTISVGGTETMRFSHSKTCWNTGLNLATIPHSLRLMFIADEGYELAELDLNRGESWIYTFLSLDPELIRIHTSGGDFHAETASAIQRAFGSTNLSPEEIAKRVKAGDHWAYKLRYLGKKVNHASAYRMGAFRGAEVVNQEADDTNITITPALMGEAQKLWKNKYIGMQGWWDGIDRELENNRQLTTPYGRVRDFYGFMDDSLKKEATATVPQSTSVDYLNRGMLRVFNDLVVPNFFGLELLHQNHDSILVQYPRQHRDAVIPEIISRIESVVRINNFDVTIPVEAMCGQNWGDYHPEKNPEGLREWTP